MFRVVTYIVFLTVCLCSFPSVFTQSTHYSIPEPTIVAFSPKGLRVTIPDDPGIQLFGFHGKVNSQFSGTGAKEGGDIAKDVLQSKSGLWIVEDENIQLEIGDSIYYWMAVQYRNLGYRKENGRFNVNELIPLNGSAIGTAGDITGTDTSGPPKCDPTATIVNGKTTCRGELIFSDDFNLVEVDKTKWTVENRFVEAPDYEFVSYQGSNQQIENGTLKIFPSLLSEDEAYIRTGTLDISSSCTGKPLSPECIRTASGYKILPPLKSAQLSSSSFSFKYGKIEIRAKLPAGDWIYPELWLTPKDNEYGPGYASGRIRIAFVRGNRELQTKEGRNLNSRELTGGFLMGQKGSLRTFGIKSRFIRDGTWSDDYHIYRLLWSPDGVTLSVDNEEYGAVIYPDGGLSEVAKKSNNDLYAVRWNTPTAPFDKEFYITLGVGVGGLSDFPDGSTSGIIPKPWMNSDPKYMLYFWQNRASWHPTWNSRDSALNVDYVRVWAL